MVLYNVSWGWLYSVRFRAEVSQSNLREDPWDFHFPRLAHGWFETVSRSSESCIIRGSCMHSLLQVHCFGILLIVLLERVGKVWISLPWAASSLSVINYLKFPRCGWIWEVICSGGNLLIFSKITSCNGFRCNMAISDPQGFIRLFTHSFEVWKRRVTQFCNCFPAQVQGRQMRNKLRQRKS